MKDKAGNVVVLGDLVRVMDIDPRITEFLPADEVRDIESMRGEVLAIVELNDTVAYVEKTWDHGAGRHEFHKIPLWPDHMVLVAAAEPPAIEC